MKASDQMKKIQDQMKELKSNFELYIVNLSIPLEERWQTFINAPAEMKNHDHYGPSFKTLPNDFVMYEGPIHADRGETIKIKEMFETIEESLEDIKNDSYCGADWHLKCFKELDVNALKEEILTKNWGAFSYDW